MEQELKEQTLEGIDGFFTKLTGAADIISAKLIEVAPAAAEAVLNIVQFKGGFKIAIAAIIISVWLFLVINTIQYLSKKETVEAVADEVHIVARLIIQGMAAFFGFFLAFAFSFDLLSFYNWLSVLYPEGAIALKALQAVGVDL